MARIIYTDTASFSTPNLAISIDAITGLITSTYAASMSYFAAGVGSYSATTTLTTNQSNVLLNAPTTINLPAGPPDGTIYTLRSTTTSVNIVINGGTYAIRNVGSASIPAVTSFNMIGNGTYMFCYYNGVWYGI